MPSPFEDLPIARLAPLRWREGADGAIELRDPRDGSWARMAPWTRDALLAIDAGEPIDGLLARDREREARARRLLMSLAKVGYLRIEVPPPRLPGHEIERELGRGGVGVAYLARDGAGREVVVKRAWGFLHPLPLAQAALRHEAQVLRSLSSPAIVPHLGDLEHEGHRFLLRGVAPGEPLLARAPGLALARRVAKGLGDALEAMHEAGFALADHKPANLFDDGARVTLADVGNARRLAEGARAAASAGFAAPEGLASVAGDVHGLGRMVAFALTGRMFRKDPQLAEVLEGIEPPAARAIAALCAPEPEKRPASLAEARDELRRALG